MAVPGNQGDIDIQLEKARLGIEAEAFVHSNLGRYLLARGSMDQERLTQELLECIGVDAENLKEIRRIHNEIKVRELFNDYLAEVIFEGKVASHQINEIDALEE